MGASAREGFKREELMKGLKGLKLFVGLTAGAVAGLMVAQSAAWAASQPCVGNVVVDVRQTVIRDPDSGVAGNNWASDNFKHHIVVVDETGGNFCAMVQDTGDFTSFEGTSPGGANHVDAGVSGKIAGGYVSEFSGDLNATAATTGGIPTVDVGCTSSDCTPTVSGAFGWADLYFGQGAHSAVANGLKEWGWSYKVDGFSTTDGNGRFWDNGDSGNFGDITGNGK
jgi:hypothetical protein